MTPPHSTEMRSKMLICVKSQELQLGDSQNIGQFFNSLQIMGWVPITSSKDQMFYLIGSWTTKKAVTDHEKALYIT